MGYEIYGLRENPFPKESIIKPESLDPRENGSIFSVDARSKEIHEFEDKFISTKTSFDDRYRCGFLWAEGDSTSGRGMGKTALALHMKHRINEEYGKNYFDGKVKFFCSYVSFPKGLKPKVDFIYKGFLRSFINERLFSHIGTSVTSTDLIKADVKEEFAEAIINNTIKDYVENLSRYSLEEWSTAWDTTFLIKLPDLFLNQTVRALKAAGFKGGILFIDDVENLTDRSTPREIESFIKDFGNAFFRADNEACNSNFFTIILTTHQQSAQKISRAWTVGGLSASFPLVSGGHSSLLTHKPDMEQCMDIIKQYLKSYRISSFTPPNEFYPLKQDDVETVINECDFHPRRFLTRLRRIIVEALSKEVKEITTEFIETVPEIEKEEESLGVEEIK